jgi:chorismate synthase
MLRRLTFLSAGESHGPELTMLLDGLPAGLPIDRDALNAELARRQRGFGAGGRMGIEKDRAHITAGVTAGRTTGGPVSIRVLNRDFANWKTRDIAPMSTPRPGHADLVGAVKYGHRDLRPSLERASARETTMRVCAGALCRQLLGALGVHIGGYAVRVGGQALELPLSHDDAVYRTRAATALGNDLCCPDDGAYDAWHAEIKAAMQAKDTLGGVFEVFALGLPVGLGSFTQWDRRLDARLGAALLSIQAMKGVELGEAFAQAGKRGTEVHDEIFLEDGALVRETNRAGGLEGGVTTGAPLLARVAMKPISTTLNPLRSVNLATGEAATTVYERSDFCALPRAVPIGEAMLALVLADAMLDKLGGDRMDEIEARLAQLKQARLDDLPLDDAPWRFDYMIDDDPPA